MKTALHQNRRRAKRRESDLRVFTKEELPSGRAAAALLVVALIFHAVLSASAGAFLLQDLAGRASAFRGQDIMGGAAIVFKRPQRVRDVVGGAAMLIVKRQFRPVVRPVEIARNTPPDRRRPRPRAGQAEPPPVRVSEEDKGEAFKNQGDTYYDLGQFAQAIEAYQNALKHTPKDPFIYNNLGAAYFSVSRNQEAADAFNKALVLKPNDPDAYFNLGIAYIALEKPQDALTAFKQAVRLKPDWPEAHNA